MALVLVAITVAVLLAAYLLYGRWLEAALGIDPKAETPAITFADGLDYVPARPAMLFGHHFSSIAGAGPIVGPVIAAVAFGWLPSLIWVLAGAVLVGGVQDLSTLVASIRHRARSVAEIAREQISPFANILFLIFVWFALIYVIVVFVDLTSATFTSDPGVASSSLLYVGLALALGLLLSRTRLTLTTASLIFVPLVFAGIWLGQRLPLVLPLADPGQAWDLSLLLYCLVASVLPVWLLLQPRDYLSSYLLFACLVGGVLGVVVGGGAVSSGAERLPAVVSFTDESLGMLFPAMFITIACGACSGFHSVVASGTTAKQLARESHARPVAYGGMLLEALLAVLAIVCVLVIGLSAARGKAPTIVFAEGFGHLLGSLGLPVALGRHFGALAISTFLLTTLDTCTRLGRYVLEELLRLPRGNRLTVVLATIGTLLVPAVFTQLTLHLPDGTPAPAWRVIWPVFGATNQLLGALALLVVTAWLRNTGRRYAFTAIPMLFMFAVSLVALVQLVWRYHLFSLIGGIAAGLLGLALLLLVEAVHKLVTVRPSE